MKYKERIVIATIVTLLVLFTLTLFKRNDISLNSEQRERDICEPKHSYMTADWTVDSIYDNLNFTVNSKDGLYTVVEKPGFNTGHQIKHSEPLRIIVVPHSHNDPGWLWTFEDYYTIRTRQILTNTIEALNRFPDFRMIWTETVFLDRWWKESREPLRLAFRDLVQKGKIEILSGGWVSVDEATTHYTAVLDQMIEGHLWIKEHFGIYPNISWSIDPFGYSSTLPYLWRKAGMKDMAILRIHGAVKGFMGNRKMLTFNWRQPWDKHGDHDIMCHVEPFTLYNIECSCGPDTEICKVLDFSSVGSFPDNDQPINFGKNRRAQNFEDFAELVVGQYKQKAALYKHNVILMPHGDDFRYIESYDFQTNYENMKRLMDYVNKKSEWNIKMEFGTVSDYFNILHAEIKKSKLKDVSLTGDFFTYTDKDNEYWSGYFTTRPFDKRMIRELQEYLRATETFMSLIYVYLLQNTDSMPLDLDSDWEAIQLARRTHSLVQHHDAITGTSTEGTVIDFEIKIYEAINSLIEIIQKRVTNILSPGTRTNVADLKLTRELPSPKNNLEVKTISSTSDTSSLVVLNSYSVPRTEVIIVYIDTYDVEVFDSKNKVVPYQVSPVWLNHYTISQHEYQIMFEVNVPAIGCSVYKIRRRSLVINHVVKPNKKDKSVFSNVISVKGKIDDKYRLFSINKDEENSKVDFIVENNFLKLSFIKATGALHEMCLKTSTKYCTKVAVDFFRYFGNNSNAYCFNSNKLEEDLFLKADSVTLITGRFMSQVKVHHKLFSHSVTLYHSNSIQGQTVHIENNATLLTPEEENTELMMRISTNIQNKDIYFTDSNGFQMNRRKPRKNLPIGANFYPFTTMAVVEDTDTRLTIHTAQPLGVASFTPGSLEIMLDRVPMSFGKGLDEPVTDNKPAISKFILHLEQFRDHHITKDYRQYQMQPSMTSYIINDLLQNPVISLYSFTSVNFKIKELSFLNSDKLPCDISIANFRSLLTESGKFIGTGLTFHKRVTSCNIHQNENICSGTHALDLNSLFKDLTLEKVSQMSLSHLHEVRNEISRVVIKPMELESFQFRWKT
ncbi:alpha-mannosidase 2-like [Mytilus edulis]|uniref:alpha-mannosidase 2-like n=1 Tax=Mytilus edulis TaxID=6550 RepID=UPI0039F131A4